MEIKFTSTLEVAKENPPVPASSNIPEWYKKTSSYFSDDGSKKPTLEGLKTATIKRCMPVFDAIGAGYLIPLAVDVYIHREEKDGLINQTISWVSSNIIEFHPIEQANLHPQASPGSNIPKFINPWIIKTPKGYSTLFIQPVHRPAPFQILPGLVDTDTYNVAVNFPFTIIDNNFEGLIPAGTPIAQAIPIKRDSWKSKFGTDKEVIKSVNIINKLNTKFFDSYKTMFRQPKEYK